MRKTSDVNMIRLETKLMDAKRAAEIATHLVTFRNDGDESWTELLDYAVDHAYDAIQAVVAEFYGTAAS